MYSAKQIAGIVKGELITQGNILQPVNHLLIDSRQINSPVDSVFFALISGRNDGHNYIEEVYTKGVRNFIVTHLPRQFQKYKNTNFILVKDTLQALQMLSAFHRRKFNIPVVGITGSNGKTIIKEWLFQLLSPDKNIVRSPKSFNSQIGVPLSVWQTERHHQLAIFEAGISKVNEMDKLQSMIYPTIGIFSNIGEAHNENFESIEQKIIQKLELFRHTEKLVYCSDHKELDLQIKKCGFLKKVQCITWGKNKNSFLILANIRVQNQKTNIQAIHQGKSIEITIPFTDNASCENAIHCWVVMLLMGYSNEIIRQRMLLLSPVAMRLELKHGINNCSIINDSYNSDINSLSIALDFLIQQKQHSKKTIILSDILQTGRKDDELYSFVAQLLAEKKIDRLIGIGEIIGRYRNKFRMEKIFFATTELFMEKSSSLQFSDEVILLKGARIFSFEKISQLLQQKLHETVLEINLSAMINNLNYYRSLLKRGTKVMAMVKAFSYGSGSYEIANILQYHHVDYLAVAFADEGVELRKAGITLPVMVMNPEQESIETFFNCLLEPEIYNFRTLEIFSHKAIEKKICLPVHLKIDTGMHRLGFEKQDIDELISKLKKNKYLKIRSVFTHLAASDEPSHDVFTEKQIKLFKQISNKITKSFKHSILLHVVNSSGISRFPEAQFDMVRLGIGLYGVSNSKDEWKLLQNVSTLKTSISQIKHIPKGDTIGYSRRGVAKQNLTIAVLPIGYADGLNRILSNGKGKLMIKDKIIPIIGNVCMDMCMIDITNLKAKEGDEVIVFGNNYSITHIAEQSHTIPYEILTGISARVKRVYFQE